MKIKKKFDNYIFAFQVLVEFLIRGEGKAYDCSAANGKPKFLLFSLKYFSYKNLVFSDRSG